MRCSVRSIPVHDFLLLASSPRFTGKRAPQVCVRLLEAPCQKQAHTKQPAAYSWRAQLPRTAAPGPQCMVPSGLIAAPPVRLQPVASGIAAAPASCSLAAGLEERLPLDGSPPPLQGCCGCVLPVAIGTGGVLLLLLPNRSTTVSGFQAQGPCKVAREFSFAQQLGTLGITLCSYRGSAPFYLTGPGS